MRYYSTQRPVAPGTFPRPSYCTVLTIHNYDSKTYVEEIGREAWGYIDYDKALCHYDMVSYELATAKTRKLHLKYLGRDSWGRYVYEDEHGKLWKNVDCISPRECCEQRGDTLLSSVYNAFDGEPNNYMADDIEVVYLKGGEGM